MINAHRIAALATWLSGTAGLVVAVSGTLPATWQSGAVAVAGLLTQAAATVKFLDGASKYEVAQVHAAQYSALDQPASFHVPQHQDYPTPYKPLDPTVSE